MPGLKPNEKWNKLRQKLNKKYWTSPPRKTTSSSREELPGSSAAVLIRAGEIRGGLWEVDKQGDIQQERSRTDEKRRKRSLNQRANTEKREKVIGFVFMAKEESCGEVIGHGGN